MKNLNGWSKACVVLLLCAATAIAVPKDTVFTTLVDFRGDNTTPGYGPLVQGTDGNFYGTTVVGNDFGSIFKVTSGGAVTTLHNFGFSDGAGLFAGLVQATNGDFYGTTYEGGSNECDGTGCGTIFKITSAGTLTTLHTFDGADGSDLFAGLVQAAGGGLYGTAYGGGANNQGTIFKITPGGTFTTIHSFDGTDGANPYAGLMQALNGDLYGTTSVGGTNNDGTIFKISPGGTFTTVHNFEGADGASRLQG